MSQHRMRVKLMHMEAEASSKSLPQILSQFTCVCILSMAVLPACLSVCILHVRARCLWRPERAPDALHLELQSAVHHYLGSWT